MSGFSGMKNNRWAFSVILLVFLAAESGLASQAKWGLVAQHPIDPRIRAEASALATENGAVLQDFSSLQAATRQGVTTSIQLKESRSLPAFLSRLRHLTRNTQEEPTAPLARQGYILQATYSGSSCPSRVTITAVAPEGFHDGLLRLRQMLHHWPVVAAGDLTPAPRFLATTGSGRNHLLRIADFPSFSERGVVETFYGKPWSHQDRIDILKFEGRHWMNSYIYAPKNDPYNRARWREPYPPAQLRQLGELASTANRHFVHFCYAISPGLSITYSSKADFATLTGKLARLHQQGISCFALFLDDVPMTLQNPQDRARFKTLAAAQASLINKLYRYVKKMSPGVPFAVTPTVYTNLGANLAYVRELGKDVNPHVELAWTGPGVFSKQVTVAMARNWGALIRRKPMLGDNFPVNDAFSWRLVLAPVRGLAPGLPSVISGVDANPMIEAHASMLPLTTVADYLWNSRAYNPNQAFHRALIQLYGKNGPQLLAPFLKAYSGYEWQDTIFKPLFVETNLPIDLPAIQKMTEELQSSLRKLRGLNTHPRLVAELAPIVNATQQHAESLARDPAFKHLPNGNVVLDTHYNSISARRMSQMPALNGDFGKCSDCQVVLINKGSQVLLGSKLWKGPGRLSARVRVGWTPQSLNIVVRITDPESAASLAGKKGHPHVRFLTVIENKLRTNSAVPAAGPFILPLQNVFQFALKSPFENTYLFSFNPETPPGTAAGFLPHDSRVRAVWKKTPDGYSGQIRIQASFFGANSLHAGDETPVTFAVLEGASSPSHNQAAAKPTVNPQTILMVSKQDPLFPPAVGNPASFQQLVLVNSKPLGSN